MDQLLVRALAMVAMGVVGSGCAIARVEREGQMVPAKHAQAIDALLRRAWSDPASECRVLGGDVGDVHVRPEVLQEFRDKEEIALLDWEVQRLCACAQEIYEARRRSENGGQEKLTGPLRLKELAIKVKYTGAAADEAAVELRTWVRSAKTRADLRKVADASPKADEASDGPCGTPAYLRLNIPDEIKQRMDALLQEERAQAAAEEERLEAERRRRAQDAAEVLAHARALAEADQVDDALIEVLGAEALGADGAEVRALIESAPTSVRRKREAEERARAAADARRRDIEDHLGGLLESGLSVQVGDDWTEASRRLRAASAGCHDNIQPGNHTVFCEGVKVPGIASRPVEVYIETLDDARISETGGEAKSLEDGQACQELLDAAHRTISGRWRKKRSEGSVEAVLPGDRRMRLFCTNGGWFQWEVADAWTLLPTLGRDTVKTLVLSLAIEAEQTVRSTGAPRANVYFFGHMALEKILNRVTRSAGKLLPRSRSTFATYKATVLDPQWLAHEFMRMVQ